MFRVAVIMSDTIEGRVSFGVLRQCGRPYFLSLSLGERHLVACCHRR